MLLKGAAAFGSWPSQLENIAASIDDCCLPPAILRVGVLSENPITDFDVVPIRRQARVRFITWRFRFGSVAGIWPGRTLNRGIEGLRHEWHDGLAVFVNSAGWHFCSQGAGAFVDELEYMEAEFACGFAGGRDLGGFEGAGLQLSHRGLAKKNDRTLGAVVWRFAHGGGSVKNGKSLRREAQAFGFDDEGELADRRRLRQQPSLLIRSV